MGTCDRIQTKSYQDISKGFSKVSAEKKPFWFTCKKSSGSAPPSFRKALPPTVQVEFVFLRAGVQNSSYPSYNNYYLIPIFLCRQRIRPHTTKLSLFSMKRQHILNSKRTQIWPSSEHILLIKQIAKKIHQVRQTPKDCLFIAALFLCQSESF